MYVCVWVYVSFWIRHTCKRVCTNLKPLISICVLFTNACSFTHIAWIGIPAVGEGTRVSLLTGTPQVVATQHSAGREQEVHVMKKKIFGRFGILWIRGMDDTCPHESYGV